MNIHMHERCDACIDEAKRITELEAQLAASCNAEEMRQVRAENIELRAKMEKAKWVLSIALHVRGTSEDTPDVAKLMEEAVSIIDSPAKEAPTAQSDPKETKNG